MASICSTYGELVLTQHIISMVIQQFLFSDLLSLWLVTMKFLSHFPHALIDVNFFWLHSEMKICHSVPHGKSHRSHPYTEVYMKVQQRFEACDDST